VIYERNIATKLYDLLQHQDVGYSSADVIRQEETMNIFRHKVWEAFLSV